MQSASPRVIVMLIIIYTLMKVSKPKLFQNPIAPATLFIASLGMNKQVVDAFILIGIADGYRK